MKCKICKSNFIELNAQINDVVLFLLGTEKMYDGKIPDEIEMTKCGCLTFKFCPKCGRMEGNFPLDISHLKWNVIHELV